MSWFDNIKTPKIKDKSPNKVGDVKVPEGFWVKCTSCGEIMQSAALKENHQVCTECHYHFRMGAWDRIHHLTRGKFKELDTNLSSNDPLGFTDTKPYQKRLQAAAENTQQYDALVTGKGTIYSDVTKQTAEAMIAAFEFKFLGGSMGVVVGEKLSRMLEVSLQKKLPAIVICSSGGARMQEGILSLMQMAKTSSLVLQMKKERIPYFTVLADPTTGGVAASFAMLGDIILAEPGALIGFAGPRVIEQTIRQALPPGFQRSEFLLKHGFVDRIVQRKELPHTLVSLIQLLQQGLWQKSSKRKR
ncbi:MAG: acetyl-CoA carboxylase, carboxyltransferase subunit beta [Bacteriovoracia bacterium]